MSDPTTTQECLSRLVRWLNTYLSPAGEGARGVLLAAEDYKELMATAEKHARKGDVTACWQACHQVREWVLARTIPSDGGKKEQLREKSRQRVPAGG